MSSKEKSSAVAGGRSALVPKLRFPGFEDVGAWNSRVIGDFLDESRVPSNLNDPSKRITVRLHLQGVEHREHRGTESLETKNNFLRKSGQFIYGKQNIHKGAFGIIPSHLEGFETSQDIPSFDFKANCSPVWFYYHLSREEVYSHFELKMTGTGSKRLNEKTFLSLPIDAPKYPEQQKIADCLDSADALIAAQGRKVEALRAHKKGLMQHLFPQEGETQPRLRFPEFEGTGDWQEAKLGDYFDPIRNGFVGTATPYYTTSEGVRYLQGKNIKQGRIEANDLVFITTDFHNRQRKSHLKPDDILMVQSGHVGECAVVGSEFAGSNCHALIILTPKRKLCSNFFKNYFYSPIGELAIFQITTGNTIKHILASELKTLSVIVPDLSEQRRIADCLTSLDDLIVDETRKLDALKTHKKGLMQQLFPQVGEE